MSYRLTAFIITQSWIVKQFDLTSVLLYYSLHIEKIYSMIIDTILISAIIRAVASAYALTKLIKISTTQFLVYVECLIN